MYAKAKMPPRPPHIAPTMDALDLLIAAALYVPQFAPDPDGKPFFPASIRKAERVEHRLIETGRHNGAANGWKVWEVLHAFRPVGHIRWYRPDLNAWVEDWKEGYRRQPVHVTAPCHREYVRHVA